MPEIRSKPVANIPMHPLDDDHHDHHGRITKAHTHSLTKSSKALENLLEFAN